MPWYVARVSGSHESRADLGSEGISDMRFAIGSLLCALVAFSAGSAADASSVSATNGKLVYVAGGKGPSYIVASKADGSNPAKLTRPTSRPGDFGERISADGLKIVFTRATKTSQQIWIVGIRGRHAHPVKITGLPPKTRPFAPTFTPNGRAIIFEVDRLLTPIGIWRVAAKGGRATRLVRGPYGGPTVSPNGRKIAFYSDSIDDFGKLKTASITGKNVQTILDWTQAGTGTFALDPDFSPDGTQLAIVLDGSSNTTGERFSRIALISIAGGDPTDLAISPLNEGYISPAFSPDGTTVAFVHIVDHANPGPTWEIDSVPAAGGSTSVLVAASSTLRFSGLDWQPRN